MKAEIRAVAITVSDRCSRGEQEDVSGKVLVGLLEETGATIVEYVVVSDELEPLKETLKTYSTRSDVNLILTTGGTGFATRDNTPEATRAVMEKEAQGLAEAIRYESLKITPMAMISRGVCGIRNGTLIINLPGSPKSVRESFAVIKPVIGHAINLLSGNTAH